MQPLHYRIAPLDAHAHLFTVSCTVADPDPSGQRFVLPTWTPGSYLIREFARHFVHVEARCGGSPVVIAKDGKSSWRAAPCQGPLEVIAHVYAFDLSVRTAYLDGKRAYFNGACVFLCPVGRENVRCVLDIDAAFVRSRADARVATSMPREGAAAWAHGRYAAADYDELIDHPVEIAEFVTTSFVAGGATHDVAITGARDVDLERLAADLARICQWECDLFGGALGSSAPFDRYVFLVMAVGDGYGGLEHRASTSLLCKRDELPRVTDAGITDDYLAFLGLVAHEYFHGWNVKRIKPAAFTPYDLSREAHTRQLWAFEGITSYYDDLALARSGVVPAERFLEVIGRTLSGVIRTPGRGLQSLGDSSFDAWIKFYRQDENSPNAGVSYYAKGAIVAMALDLTLREHGSSLDALMRELWRRFGTSGAGVGESDIKSIASELAKADLEDFFARHIDGVEDPPLAKLLSRFGVRLSLRATESMRDRGGKLASLPRAPATWIGAKWPPSGEMRLANVFGGGPAARAGLSANDVVIAVNGLRASGDTLTSLLGRASPGDRVSVDAFRRDELLHFDVTLDAAPQDTAYLALATDVDAATLQRRNAWLGA
ncbi:MAG: PDZ domain-containing protein [Betaproteobacteria bacterium]